MSKSPLKGLGGSSKSPMGALRNASFRGQPQSTAKISAMSVDMGKERSFGQTLIDAQRPKVPLAESRTDRLVHGHQVGWLQIKVARDGGVPEYRWMWVEISLGLTNNEPGVGGLQESSQLSLFDESQEHVRRHKDEATLRLAELEEELDNLLKDEKRGGAYRRSELIIVHSGIKAEANIWEALQVHAVPLRVFTLERNFTCSSFGDGSGPGMVIASGKERIEARARNIQERDTWMHALENLHLRHSASSSIHATSHETPALPESPRLQALLQPGKGDSPLKPTEPQEKKYFEWLRDGTVDPREKQSDPQHIDGSLHVKDRSALLALVKEHRHHQWLSHNRAHTRHTLHKLQRSSVAGTPDASGSLTGGSSLNLQSEVSFSGPSPTAARRQSALRSSEVQSPSMSAARKNSFKTSRIGTGLLGSALLWGPDAIRTGLGVSQYLDEQDRSSKFDASVLSGEAFRSRRVTSIRPGSGKQENDEEPMFLGGEGEGDFVSSPVAAGGGNSPDAKFLGEDTSNQPIGAGYGRKNQKSIAGREEVQDWEDHDEDSESDIDPFEGVDIDEMRGNMGELVSGEHGMTLHWQRKELDAVPDQLWKIPVYGELAQLYLEANVIKTLPIELAQFTKLETLSVSQNRLKALPEWLVTLPRLSTIAAAANMIDTLPARIGQLTSLTAFNLFDNKLEVLPTNLGQCTHLKLLNLQRNKFVAMEDAPPDEEFSNLVHVPRASLANIKEGRIPLLIRELLPFLRHLDAICEKEETRKVRDRDQDAERVRRQGFKDHSISKAVAYLDMTDEQKDQADREAMQAAIEARRAQRQ